MRRVGLIGLGVISRFYLAAFDRVPGLELVAVCDHDARALAGRCDDIARYRDHRAMLAAEGLDAVVVTVPNDQHPAVCSDALAAGVSVCVEKPLAIRLDDGRRLLEHAARRGLTLFTSFHRRYNTAVGALLAGLPAGVRIEAVTVRYLERIEEHTGRDAWYLDPSRCGGGCLADNGPNAYDLVRLLLGDCGVVAAELRRDTHGVDRQATVLLEASSGATGRIELDWSYPGERKDVEVWLADGTVRHVDLLADHIGFKASLWHEYVGVLTDFAGMLSNPVPGADPGLSALEFVNSAYRTSDTIVEA